MEILDPELIRFLSRCRLLFWKALLMRKNTLIFTFLELIVPIFMAFQIRLIFDPLALDFQNLEQYPRKNISNFFPKNAECWYAPKNTFSDELMSKASQILNISVSSEVDEKQLIKNHFPKNGTPNVFWVIFQTKDSTTPKHLKYTIRSSEIGKSRMIILKEEDPMDVDPYLQSGFLALQLAIEDSFFRMWKKTELKEIDITIGRFPFHKINFLIMPSISRPNVSIIYYMSIVAFILLPLSTVIKLIHDKESGFTDLLRILGISNSFLYFGWLIYLATTAIPVTIVCTSILYPIYSNNNDALQIGIFLLFHILVTSAFMIAIGSFFTNTTKAVLTCLLFWLFMARITIELDQFLADSSLGIKISSLVLPHTGLLHGIAALTSKTAIDFPTDENLNSKAYSIDKKQDLSEGSSRLQYNDEIFSEKNMVSLILVLMTWFFHIIFWLAIANYLDNIMPGKSGSKKSWFYPCKKEVRKIETVNVTHKGTTNWYAVETVPPIWKPAIRVRNITKKFGSIGTRITAVDNMTIDFYRREFNVILGHNGAGKSTLLKLLVGIYKPTHGHVYIEEEDPKIKRLYSQIGFCAQENIFVDYLTVLQHLYLLGMVKGLSYEKSLKESLKLLKQLDLQQEQNSKLKGLNFGVQRRVCIAMALIGDVKILVLDEPNYGIDPVYGKGIWTLLWELKRKITVIMATNSMEAADIADRIAIFVNGKVECYGSKKYLNQHFGIGYILSMVFREGCDLNLLREEVQEFSAEPVTQRDIMGRVVKYNVPRRSQVTKLLEYLEFHRERLNITSVSINATNIEGQFLKIGLASQFRERKAFFIGTDYELIVQRRRRDLINSGESWERLTGQKLIQHQIVAMLYKKLLHIAWTWKFYLLCIIFTVITIGITMTISSLGKTEFFHTAEVYMNVSKYTKSNSFLLFYGEKGETATKFLTSMITTGQSYNKGKNYHISRNISATEIMINPKLHSIEFRDRYFMSIDILESGGVKMMYSSHAVHSGPIALNLLYNSLLREHNFDDCKITLNSRPLVNPTQWQHRVIHPQGVRSWGNAAVVISLLLILPSIDLGIREKRSGSKQLQLNTSGVTTLIFWMPNYFLDLLLYFLSFSIMALIGYISYRGELFDFSAMAFFEVTLIFLLYGAAAFPLNYCLQLFPIKTGTIYFIVFVITVSVVLLNNISVLFPIITQHLTKIEKYIFELALHAFPPYVLGCAIGNYITLFLYDYQCKQYNTCDTDFKFEDPCCQNCDEPDSYCYKPYKILLSRKSGDKYYHSVLEDMGALLLQAIFFNILLQIFEKKNFYKWFHKFKKILRIISIVKKRQVSQIIMELVETAGNSILEEKEKCAELMKEFEDTRNLRPEVLMVVQDLRKKYGKKMVLHGLDFIMNRKECFGLLGMNSSGKSTVFKLLTGETNLTKGKAVIQKYQLEKNSDEFLGLVGYCPQYGGLNNYFTGRQNLIFFAMIRGVPYQNVKQEVNKWIDVFDLLDFENTKVDNSTWGVQRKICILQSLIGDLPILYLDDPSSGIDLLAKHALCEVLNHVREMGRSLLLTTHSIQDAEALCFRVGILLDGKFAAIGTCEDLKNMYGNNFTLNIKLNPEQRRSSIDETEFIKGVIMETFPDIICKEQSFLGMLTFEIPGHLVYSNVFGLVQKLMQKYPSIQDFSLNQPTLEKVFLELSKRPETPCKEKVPFYQPFFDWIRAIFAHLCPHCLFLHQVCGCLFIVFRLCRRKS